MSSLFRKSTPKNKQTVFHPFPDPELPKNQSQGMLLLTSRSDCSCQFQMHSAATRQHNIILYHSPQRIAYPNKIPPEIFSDCCCTSGTFSNELLKNLSDSYCICTCMTIDLLMGLFRGTVFHHGVVPKKCPLALMPRFPSLMGRFPSLMAHFSPNASIL